MSDLKQEIHMMTPVPMRTAEEQWRIAGYQCGVYATLDREGLVFVSGNGGQACMRKAEWTAYQERCLQGAQSISMMAVESEEEARRSAEDRLKPKQGVMLCPHCRSGLLWSEDRGAHCDGCDDFDPETDLPGTAKTSDFARSFREIEQCLLAHARCLSDDERDEIVRQIGAKVLPLKEAVLRAEEIWLEGARAEMIKAERKIERLRVRIKEQGFEIEQRESEGGAAS